MANLLKMAISETIRTLHRRGWSQRRIAAELGINRETVARHLRQADPPSKPANAPPGSEADLARQNQPMRPPARKWTAPRQNQPMRPSARRKTGARPRSRS